MATKQRVISTAVEGMVITFKVAGAGECALDLDAVDNTLRERAMFHGFIQRVSDAAALDRGATAEEKLAEMARLCEHYNSGSSEWRIAGTGGGGADSITVLAMQRVYGGTVADQEAYLAKMCAKRGIDRKAALKVFSGAGKIAEAIAAIQAERAAKRAATADVDADSLIDEIE